MDAVWPMEEMLWRVLRPLDPAENENAPIRRLLWVVVGGGAVYGATMGAFSAITGQHLAQILFSAIKVPLLQGVTAALCLPAVWIFYTLHGLQGEFKTALRALISGQAALAVVLASLAPFTFVAYLSGISYSHALLFNAAIFGVAAFSAQGIIKRQLRGLFTRNPKHRYLLRLWFALFAFVGIQMAWNLRPFIGQPDAPAQFIRLEGVSNAYLTIWRMVVR